MCGAGVMIGLSDDVCAFMAYVDPNPLGPVGEYLAQASGRRTYSMRRFGQSVRLYQRDRWQIAGRPAGDRGRFAGDVVPDHVCGTPLPGIPTQLHLPTPEGVDDEHPPF